MLDIYNKRLLYLNIKISTSDVVVYILFLHSGMLYNNALYSVCWEELLHTENQIKLIYNNAIFTYEGCQILREFILQFGFMNAHYVYLMVPAKKTFQQRHRPYMMTR